MITYDPLWETMKKKGVSTYALIHKYRVSSSTVHRLKHNKPVTTTTINDLCFFLDCNVSDILKYVSDDLI